MDKKGGFVFDLFCVIISALLIIGMLTLLMTLYFNGQEKMNNLCESKDMKLIQQDTNYCLEGNKLYKIIQVDNNFRLAKEVVTLE